MNTQQQDNKVKVVKFAPFTLRKEYTYDNNGEQVSDFALLSWSIRMGYPRMTVFLANRVKEPKMNYDNMINAPFDYLTFQMLIETLKTVIATDGECTYAIDCFNTKFENNQKTNEIELQAKVLVGRSATGELFLAAISGNKRKVKFDLTFQGRWHIFYDNTGKEILDKKSLSNMYAKAYVKTLEEVIMSEAKIDLSKTSQIDSPTHNTFNAALAPKPTQIDVSIDDLI